MFTTRQGTRRRQRRWLRLTDLKRWDDIQGRKGLECGLVNRTTQGDGPAGMISSKIGRAEQSNFTNWPKASLPCCQQVRKTLARICCVRAPLAVRLPPQVLRAIAINRIARSAKLLVASKPGQRRNVNRCGCSWQRCLASR